MKVHQMNSSFCFLSLFGGIWRSQIVVALPGAENDAYSNSNFMRTTVETDPSPDTSTIEKKQPQLNDRIAIIGGGVHGVLTARALKKLGYSNIVVFEKEDKLAASTESFQTENGDVFDYSTKFIPADTVTGHGMPANMAELFDDYGLSTRPYMPEIKNYLFPADVLYPLPEVLLKYAATPEGQEQLISNLIAGFELLKTAATTARSPEALIEAGIVLKSETWAQFSERINLPAFTELCTFLQDIFLGGPTNEYPAASMLNVRAVFTPSYMKAILLGLGVSSTTALPISSELRDVLSNPFTGTSYVINEGYQAVFEAIVEQENIYTCLGCTVVKIKKANEAAKERVSVFYVRGRRSVKDDFDHVIMSSRPHDSVNFLKGNSHLKDLVSQATNKQNVTTLAFRGSTHPPTLGESFVAVVYPGASTFPRDGTIFGVAKDFQYSDVFVAIGYTDPDGTKDEGIEKALADLSMYSIEVSELIGYRTYKYPSIPDVLAVNDDWFTKMSNYQGVDNMYIVGEALSGTGVPTALNFVADFVDKYFSNGIQS